MEGVGARLTADEIVPPLRVALLVGRGIELKICFGDRADQACRDLVARRAGGLCLVRPRLERVPRRIAHEGIAPDPATSLLCRERVINLEGRVDREQG